jgi:ribonuclease P protein component
MTHATEFKDALRTKPVGQGKVLLLHYCPAKSNPASLSSAKLGLIIPKRYLRLAVDRNRVKRVLRESFRHLRQDLPAGSYLFRLKLLPRSLPKSQLKQIARQEADKLLSKLRASKPHALATD